MTFVDVSDIFWPFCKAAAFADSMDEFKGSPEYEKMNDAVTNAATTGTNIAIRADPPLRKRHTIIPFPKIVEALESSGCPGCPGMYVFEDVNRLFDGVREILDPHATAHETVLIKCIQRIHNHVDTDDLSVFLSEARME